MKPNLQRRIREYMLTECRGIGSATMLAENAAHAFGHDEWLDDMNHPVWAIAIDVWEIESPD